MEKESINQSGREMEGSKYEVPIVRLSPFIEPKHLEILQNNSDAVVLVVFVSGTVPKRLAEPIGNLIKKDIPVFLVSSNIGDEHGILNPYGYSVTVPSLEAGAVPIEKLNVKDLPQILKCIQKYLEEGKRGQELGKLVGEEFSYKEGEKKPVADWDERDGANLDEVRKSTRRIYEKSGFSGKELDDAMHKWEFGDEK